METVISEREEWLNSFMHSLVTLAEMIDWNSLQCTMYKLLFTNNKGLQNFLPVSLSMAKTCCIGIFAPWPNALAV